MMEPQVNESASVGIAQNTNGSTPSDDVQNDDIDTDDIVPEQHGSEEQVAFDKSSLLEPLDHDTTLRIAMPSGRPILAGYLHKHPKDVKGKNKQTWVQRYFELYNSTVVYYKSQSDTVPAGMLKLSADFYVTAPSGKQGHDGEQYQEFVLCDLTHSMHLGTESKESLALWMQAIKRVLRTLQEDGSHISEQLPIATDTLQSNGIVAVGTETSQSKWCSTECVVL